jgi:hypothetical protein
VSFLQIKEKIIKGTANAPREKNIVSAKIKARELRIFAKLNCTVKNKF